MGTNVFFLTEVVFDNANKVHLNISINSYNTFEVPLFLGHVCYRLNFRLI